MRLSIVSVFLSVFGLLYGDKNLLLNVPVFASERQDKEMLLNDGDTKGKLFYFDSSDPKWAVFDMGDAYQLSKIIIWNGNYFGKDPVSFYIGNEFIPCKFYRQILNYKLCNPKVIQARTSTTISCAKSGDTGRYLAILKGDLQSKNAVESLYLFEIQAFGTLVAGQTFPTRPEISSGTLDPISKTSFPISSAILNGVGTLTIPLYSTQLIYLNKNCQPIIWEPSSMNIFSVACQTTDGKGRITVFGKESYLSDIIANSKISTLKRNLLNWLSPKSKTPSVVSTEKIKSLSDLKAKVKPGDIIDFYTWNPYTDDVLNAIISLCLDGTNSINLDHTFWVSVAANVKAPILKILQIFNLDFPTTVMNYRSVIDFTVTDDLFNDSLLGAEQLLERMAINNNFFLANGVNVARGLASMSTTLLVNSNVATSLKAIVKKYDPLLNWICPCQAGPAIDVDDRAIINIYSQLVLNQGLANSNYKAPCVDLFPGDFDTPPPTQSVTITIQSQTDNTKYPIGFYLAAGSTLQYNVVASVGDWTISVGCHSDVLTDKRPQWARYPSIYTDSVALTKIGQIYSPYGGALWLGNSVINQSITVKLSNVVATPFFNGRDSSAPQAWQSQRTNPGLWAQIGGEAMVICEKSANVKDFDGNYLMDLMKNTWDKVVKLDYAINGIDWKVKRPQIVTLDIMTSVGYGHSGYPIVVWYDWFVNIFNKTYISQTGSWGMCHEIGHNLQDSRWTFAGLTEVTNNLLCLYNYDKLWRVNRYGNDLQSLIEYQGDITDYLSKGANFADYKKSPWIALAVYTQMINNFGWGFFKNVFKYYNDNNITPADEDTKILTWINTTSIISGQNLMPLFQFWGIPINDGALAVVSALPCFFPDDFLINFSPTRRDMILQRYPKCNRNSIFFKDYDPTNDIMGSVSNFIKQS